MKNMDFKKYDIIEYAGDYFMVLKNYGHKGRVQEYFPGGNVGEIIDPFYWVYEGLECSLVNHAHMREVELLREEVENLKFMLEGTEINLKNAKKQIELLYRYIDKLGFCPDCRDKTDGHCYRCKVQSLENKLLNIKKFALSFQCEDVAPDICSGTKQIAGMIKETE